MSHQLPKNAEPDPDAQNLLWIFKLVELVDQRQLRVGDDFHALAEILSLTKDDLVEKRAVHLVVVGVMSPGEGAGPAPDGCSRCRPRALPGRKAQRRARQAPRGASSIPTENLQMHWTLLPLPPAAERAVDARDVVAKKGTGRMSGPLFTDS